MSAAWAPATATKPAAEPRRRLLTIFIVTSKLCREGSVERSPIPVNQPAFPVNSGRGDLGMPPSVALLRLSEGNRQGNDKEGDAAPCVLVSIALLHECH